MTMITVIIINLFNNHCFCS